MIAPQKLVEARMLRKRSTRWLCLWNGYLERCCLAFHRISNQVKLCPRYDSVLILSRLHSLNSWKLLCLSLWCVMLHQMHYVVLFLVLCPTRIHMSQMWEGELTRFATENFCSYLWKRGEWVWEKWRVFVVDELQNVNNHQYSVFYTLHIRATFRQIVTDVHVC